jgi:hypothetical protein
MTIELVDGDRYLDRHGDTWEARAGGTYLKLVDKAGYGPVVNGWFEAADTLSRDFGPMVALNPKKEQQ